MSQQVYYMLFTFHNKSVTYRADKKNRVRTKIELQGVCDLQKWNYFRNTGAIISFEYQVQNIRHAFSSKSVNQVAHFI